MPRSFFFFFRKGLNHCRLFLLPLYLLPNIANASRQPPDILLYKGDTIALFKLLVEEYLQARNEPENGRLFGLSFRDSLGTACWRGYRAVYKIENDSLFLVYMIDCYDRYEKGQTINDSASQKRIATLFGDRFRNGRVFIDWFSGKLPLPGKRLLRWDGILERNYYTERLLVISNGLFHKERVVQNYVDRRRGISRDLPENKWTYVPTPVTDTVFALLRTKAMQKWEECICDMDFRIIINARGRIRKVHLQALDDPKENQDWEDELRPCINKMLRVFRKLRFDIVRWHGDPWEETIFFSPRCGK